MPVLINAFGFASDPVWNSADKDADCTLSDGDRTASITADGSVRSTAVKATGKWYVEATSGTGATAAQWRFGVGNASMAITDGVGKDANGWAFQGNGNKVTGDTSASYGTANSGSDDLMLALNADTGSVWIGRGGTWLNSGDPAAGTNAMFTGMTGPFYLGFGSAGSTRAITLKTSAACLYTPPTGFLKAW